MEANGEKFAEETNGDVARQTEEIKVPKRKDLMVVDTLNYFNLIFCQFS